MWTQVLVPSLWGQNHVQKTYITSTDVGKYINYIIIISLEKYRNCYHLILLGSASSKHLSFPLGNLIGRLQLCDIMMITYCLLWHIWPCIRILNLAILQFRLFLCFWFQSSWLTVIYRHDIETGPWLWKVAEELIIIGSSSTGIHTNLNVADNERSAWLDTLT